MRNVESSTIMCFMLCVCSMMIGGLALWSGFQKVSLIMPVIGCLLFMKGLFSMDRPRSYHVSR